MPNTPKAYACYLVCRRNIVTLQEDEKVMWDNDIDCNPAENPLPNLEHYLPMEE